MRGGGGCGEVRGLAIVGFLGFLGMSPFVFLGVLALCIGRIAGPAWIILGLLIYFWYRRRRKLPVRKTLKRNWEKEQLLVYEDAGEHDMADEYRENLPRKRRLLPEEEPENNLPVGPQGLQ